MVLPVLGLPEAVLLETQNCKGQEQPFNLNIQCIQSCQKQARLFARLGDEPIEHAD